MTKSTLSRAIGFALALAACSRIDLAYRNLDRLVHTEVKGVTDSQTFYDLIFA